MKFRFHRLCLVTIFIFGFQQLAFSFPFRVDQAAVCAEEGRRKSGVTQLYTFSGMHDLETSKVLYAPMESKLDSYISARCLGKSAVGNIILDVKEECDILCNSDYSYLPGCKRACGFAHVRAIQFLLGYEEALKSVSSCLSKKDR